MASFDQFEIGRDGYSDNIPDTIEEALYSSLGTSIIKRLGFILLFISGLSIVYFTSKKKVKNQNRKKE